MHSSNAAVENVTCTLTCEVPDLSVFMDCGNPRFRNLTDNLLLLGLTPDEQMRRTLRVIKPGAVTTIEACILWKLLQKEPGCVRRHDLRDGRGKDSERAA